MVMTNNVPGWMTPVAWAFIIVAVATAALIAFDIYGRGRRHDTIAGEIVWVTSALYLGPFAFALYSRYGRTSSRSQLSPAATTSLDSPAAVDGLPGGGASAVAHLIGVPLVVASGLTIAGIDLWVMIMVIGVLAMALLFVFERITANARGRQVGVGAAAGAAALTVLAFDVGMGGWMLLLHFNEYMPPATEGSFWFLMQIGIVLGLVTGYPAVAWLSRRGRAVTAV